MASCFICKKPIKEDERFATCSNPMGSNCSNKVHGTCRPRKSIILLFRCLYMKFICVFYIVTEIEQRFNSMITLPNRYTCTNCTEADSRGVAGHDAGRARGRSRGRGFFPVLSKLIDEPHFTMYSNNNDTVTSVMCRPELESTVNHQQTTLPIFSRCFERGFKPIFFAVD